MAQLGAGAAVELQHNSGLGQVDGRRRHWGQASLVAVQQIRLQAARDHCSCQSPLLRSGVRGQTQIITPSPYRLPSLQAY